MVKNYNKPDRIQMRIQDFSIICLSVAKGAGTRDLLSGYVYTQKFFDNFIKTATSQKVLPLVSNVIADANCQKFCIKNGIDVSGIKPPKHFVARNIHLKAQLQQIDTALEGTNIKPVLLKGAIQLFDGLYCAFGMRNMADIDFLSTDTKLLQVLGDLGYSINGKGQENKVDEDANTILNSGGSHLTPRVRVNDLVHLEPHFLPVSPMYMDVIPKAFETETLPLPGCDNLVQPTLVNHLIHVLVHTLKHDRDTLDGGISVRGLIDCELIYEKMTPEQKLFTEQYFTNNNAKNLWISWRSLSDWVFRDAKSAIYNSFGSFFLIAEFKLRSLGYHWVFMIAFFNRLMRLFNYKYWTTKVYRKHAKRLVKRDFWDRILSKFKAVVSG